jgi:hypothetical protein
VFGVVDAGEFVFDPAFEPRQELIADGQGADRHENGTQVVNGQVALACRSGVECLVVECAGSGSDIGEYLASGG